MSDFLNASNSVFTSARDDGTGKPVTDVAFTNEIPTGSNIIGYVQLTDGTHPLIVNADGSINISFTNAVDIKSLPSLPIGDNVIGRIKLTDGTNGLVFNSDGTLNAKISNFPTTQAVNDANVLSKLTDLLTKQDDIITRLSGTLDTKPTGSLLEEQKTNADVTSGTYEIASLNITAIPSSVGNITVTLDGVAKTITVDPSTDTTTDSVATKIRNTTFTGWTTGGTASNVTFTATTYGDKTDPSFSGGSTGVTGTISTTTQGNAVLTFSENITAIGIYNRDTVNDGVFNVNGISITVPKDVSADFNLGGTPGTDVTITGSKSFIISRYV